jgi:N,N'-diacetyllegionaminate synthase
VLTSAGHMPAPPKQLTLSPGRCLIIGEVAQAHDGSLGMAHAFIDAIARAGADAVKFQTHLAEPWRIRFSPQDSTRYAYWQRMEFTEEQWRGLKEHAERAGLVFLSSPFSVQAVELLQRLGITAWKVASGEVSNDILLERLLSTGLPILCSTGMSPWSEIDRMVERVRQARVLLALMQCTSVYPCPPERVGLNLLGEMRTRYDCPVGLSDHSGTIYPGLAAAAIGCEVLEIHVTLSREAFGPDVSSSVTTSELRQLVDGIRFIEKMHANPLDKNRTSVELAPARSLFTQSLIIEHDMPSGARLERDDLGCRKPGTGIATSRIQEVLGKRLRRPYRAGEVLEQDDLEA